MPSEIGGDLRQKKGMVGMTLNFFFIEFIDHIMYGLEQKALKRSGTHGLNIKWNLRHGPAWLIYRPLPWSVALCAGRAHLAIWKLSFLESGKFGQPFFMENPLYKLKLYFSGRNLEKFPQKQKRWFGG